MIKKYLLLIMLVITCMTLSACGNKPKEDKVKEDIKNYLDEKFDEEEVIEVIEITDSYTKEDSKEKEFYCKVNSNDGEISYEKHFVVTYKKYDKNGWILEEVEENNEIEWTREPLVGVSENLLRHLLNGTFVEVNEESWCIEEINIKDILIKEQNTDIEAKKDEILVELIIEDEVAEASGELNINFIFDDEWKIDSISGKDKFISKIKPEKELKITAEDIISLIEGKINYIDIERKNGEVYIITSNTSNTITIGRGEISDLIIESHESENKGKHQIYYGKFSLVRPNASYKFSFQIMYVYISGEWIPQPYRLKPIE